jgi:hypothetical protein
VAVINNLNRTQPTSVSWLSSAGSSRRFFFLTFLAMGMASAKSSA